jgi:tetratricopeptide (TPR) repeat protein
MNGPEKASAMYAAFGYSAIRTNVIRLVRFLSAPVRVVVLFFFRLLPRANKEYYYVKLGDALIDLRLYSSACRYFKHALEIQDSVWSHVQIGCALINMERYEEALMHYRRVYALCPDPLWAAAVACLEHGCGYDDKARDMLTVALKDPALLDNITLQGLKDLQEDIEKNHCA